MASVIFRTPLNESGKPVVKVGIGERIFKVSKFLPAEKQRLWAGIKRNQPAFAELLTNDEDFKALKEAFDADLVLTATEIQELIK